MKGIPDIVAADTTGEQEMEKDIGSIERPLTRVEIIGAHESDDE
jgi:hypothetical protein